MVLEIDLSGKSALITAASKGIGYGIADILAKCGADVIITARNEENLRKAAEDLKNKHGVDVYWVKADNTKLDDLSNLVNFVEGLGGVDIFVFNTGGPKPGNFMDLDMKDWEDSVRILLYPAVYLTRALLRRMLDKGWGRIIYSTSVAIKEPMVGLVLSNAVRLSLAGLIRTLSKEVGGKGITVNGIMPGYILTDRVKEIAIKRAEDRGVTVDDIINEIVSRIPASRMGSPQEIGYLAAFLASDYASYINGAIIPVDGGLLNSSL